MVQPNSCELQTLITKIEKVRKELYILQAQKNSLLDECVLAKSRQLDKLIVMYYRKVLKK